MSLFETGLLILESLALQGGRFLRASDLNIWVRIQAECQPTKRHLPGMCTMN